MESTFTLHELAELAHSTPARVRQLVDLRLITAVDSGYASGDVHRVRLVNAFEAAGVPATALAAANEGGAISLAYYDQLHLEPAEPSRRTYGELLGSLEDDAGLGRLLAASGVAAPDADTRLGRDEEQLLLALVGCLRDNRDPDLLLRTVRVFGESARRASEGAMSVYGEAVERAATDIAGIPPEAVYERLLEPWARFARLVPDMARWLHQRHLSAAIDAWSVEETERVLGESGFVPPRDAVPPAVAFIDLTGFTRLVEQQGDRAAAAAAAQLAELARTVGARHGGQLVKQLGDGVLLRFRTASDAVGASLDVLDGLAAAPAMPSGHAGVASGPIITREGDVFGRTVNRAARLADTAGAGELLVTASLAEDIEVPTARFEAVGEIALQGVDGPVKLVRVVRVHGG